MDPIDPVHGTGVLLLIAAVAVAVLLTLIIKLRMHAFVALVLTSLLTAIATGIPLADVPLALTSGFGSTLASVALLVGFGVMIGRLLEASGGAQVLADTLVSRFGERRAPFALGVAAFLFGLPIFFDAGLVVFLPIIITVARRFGGSVLLYALPAAGAFAATHAWLPPHPGPVAAGTALGGDLGIVLLVNLPIAIVAWYVGAYLFSQFVGRRIHVDVSSLVLGEQNDGSESDAAAPRFGLVLGILLVPMVLIGFNTVLTTLGASGAVDADNPVVQALVLLGNTPVALLVTLLVALLALGGGRTAEQTRDLVDDALAPICSIILITGAGGMFGGVLRTSGIGDALTDSLGDLGVPLLLQAFLIAAALRVAQGSATVALTTASGLIAAQAADLGDVQIALLVTAIAAGSTVLSHVNDSGFWLFSRFFGADEKTTLRTWTVQETTLGLTAFALAAVLYPLVG